ncbi:MULTISPECIES: choice-of-anchor M domain-containing protein [unclassified Corynebacterium]|uniref:choice-of-anchor M domain-containing protein n=1 Tax=Corynebacterium TaxID=1716 RepID=UPI00254F90A7|nr:MULTISPECIES: choice-of-anchor M domain-containing protein [unclassified Corynebacterium]MDK8476567.1 choice-of-anchor M domain-containing protein [Corynebacterium sp. MSK310]MDK8672819.1 choice-of-anchor M domain-containing protein [Corynebacterium sp. MSK189]MDK8736238.1 choice-of-anchor M domain-containing protein [Corynebacterium sp. MSK306]
MKPLCRTALALGAAGFLSVGTLTGVGLPSSVMATAHAAEACSAEDFIRITEGHQDMALKDESGDINFVVKDDQKRKEYQSEEFVVEVAEKNKQPISALNIPSLPEEGWVLPQTQIEDVPWLGFNTQELSEDYLGSKQTATLSMAIASGPEDGRIVAFQNEGIGELKVRMDTEDGTAWDYPGKSHAHPAFAFTKPGTYAVSFTFELPDGSRHHLHAGFLVGDDADAAELCGVDYEESDDAEASVPTGGTSRPNQLAKDIKGVDKAIAGLDKELENTLKEGQKFLEGDKKKDKGAKDKSGDKPTKQGQSGGSKEVKNSGSKQGSNQGSKSGSKSGSTKGSARGSGQSKTNQAHGSGAGSGAASRKSGGGSSKGASASSGSRSGSKAAQSKSGGSSGQKSAGKSTPKSKSSKAKDSKSKGSKSEHRSTAPVPNASAGGKDHNNEALAGAAYTASLTKSSFWAGILAGLGAFALVLGIGLLVYVQFFRKKKLAGEQPEQPEQPVPPQADDATTQIPRID